MLDLYVIDTKHRYALVNEFGLEQRASEGSASHRWINVSEQRPNRFNAPRARQWAERRLNKRIPTTVAEVAEFVDAAGEEVVEQALLGLFELGDEPLRRPDSLIHRIQDLGNPPLLSDWRQQHIEFIGVVPIEPGHAG